MTSRPRQSRRRWTGREGPQLTNSLGRNSTEKTKGSCPETNVISLEHRANRAMFQNKPATHASSEWCEFPSAASELRFDGGPPPADRRPPPRQVKPQGWKREGSSIVPVLVFMCAKQTRQGGGAECGAEEGWARRTCASLIDAATAKAVRN